MVIEWRMILKIALINDKEALNINSIVDISKVCVRERERLKIVKEKEY